MKIELLKILQDKDLAKTPAEPVKEITREVKDFCINLCLTMRQAQGLGIAAPQVGEPKRIIVIDTTTFSSSGGHGCAIMINPEVLEITGEQTNIEGCLSFPGKDVKVKRGLAVRVKWLTTQNDFTEATFRGIAAAVILHECEHLEGLTFLDKGGYKL